MAYWPRVAVRRYGDKGVQSFHRDFGLGQKALSGGDEVCWAYRESPGHAKRSSVTSRHLRHATLLPRAAAIDSDLTVA